MCPFVTAFIIFTACLFLTALNAQQNRIIDTSPGCAAKAPRRAAQPGSECALLQRNRCSKGSLGTGLPHRHTSLPAARAVSTSGTAADAAPSAQRCCLFACRGKSDFCHAQMCFVVSITSSWKVSVEGERTALSEQLLSKV